MRQILYVSRSNTTEGKADLDAIVQQSRHNNALEGVTGLLWSDGTRFLQVIEGPEESVQATFDRILDDARHSEIEVLSVRTVTEREFGGWTMAHRNRWDTADAFDEKVKRALSRASRTVRTALLDLVAVKAEA